MKRICLVMLALMLFCGCTPTPQSESRALSLAYRGVALTIGDAADGVIAQLGDDYTLSEAESCAGEGVDRMYTYPSVRIYVFAPREGLATVTSVSYTDDGADTDGVCIGCDVALVEQAFGTPDERREGAIVYRRDGAVLTVTEQGGRVNAVLLTEDE